MNDGKGWSLRRNRKVASVSSREGFSFTFPSAEVCVNHCVHCFALECETTKDLYAFLSLFCFEIPNFESGFNVSSTLASKHWTEGCKLEVRPTQRPGLRDLIGTSKHEDCLCHLNIMKIRGNVRTVKV